MTSHQANLRGGLPRRAKPATSAVLVLHGGQEHNTNLTSARQLAVLRMLDMYVGLRRRSRKSAIYLLRYRVRGWNASPTGQPEPGPVVDARQALDQITDRHGDIPVVLLGHSMGGRTAFAIAADPRVAGICALAPWLPIGEPLPKTRGAQRFVMAHGTADRTTSPAGSLEYAERLRAGGARVARFELEGGRHDLLQSFRLWHQVAVTVSLGLAGDSALPAAVQAALEDNGPGGLRLPLTSLGGS